LIDWLLSGGWIALCGFFGPIIWLQNPLPGKAKPVVKTAKRSTKRTNRKSRTVQKIKAKKAKPKKWAKPPKYTPEQLVNIERMFAKGRGENKFYNWAGVPL